MIHETQATGPICALTERSFSFRFFVPRASHQRFFADTLTLASFVPLLGDFNCLPHLVDSQCGPCETQLPCEVGMFFLDSRDNLDPRA